MKLSRTSHAVSAATAAVAFALLGCGIALCGILAGVGAGVLKFFLVAYACVAGPLFFAAAMSSKSAPGKHRSFRPTPHPSMEGKRLKRRLLWIACLSYPLALVTMGLTFAALVLLLARVRIAARGNIWEGPLCIGVCAGVGCLTLFLLKVLYVRLGWMTREESRPFPFQM